ncbi:NucA/NucB deoxyribonuclease domain-containing protein [Streptomonospora alba]|uniref:NucA/NucB deoxyribonuclease domain-containing protein n=1 Tax=Streptomonospora alba TaxID=183763 RepID=UPI00146FE5A0|nr:NucA/NucB deoxyribonuclease domain-containing protein [Streptomonospora alba]
MAHEVAAGEAQGEFGPDRIGQGSFGKFRNTSNSSEVTPPPSERRSGKLTLWETQPEWSLTYIAPDDGPQFESGDFQLVSDMVSLDMGVSSPGATPPYSAIGEANINARYDYRGSSNYVPTPKGTVFQDAQPYFSLSLNDPAVNEQAQHMRDALERPYLTFPSWVGKTVPGTSEPLHRTTDETQRDRNREKAISTCRDVWGSDYGSGNTLHCDEFPFATTMEGAGAGTDRFSARPIDRSDNEEAGRRQNTFYKSNRILHGDAFRVEVTS